LSTFWEGVVEAKFQLGTWKAMAEMQSFIKIPQTTSQGKKPCGIH
jgi:hypothetical protein